MKEIRPGSPKTETVVGCYFPATSGEKVTCKSEGEFTELLKTYMEPERQKSPLPANSFGDQPKSPK
jgi:hypothetical protein